MMRNEMEEFVSSFFNYVRVENDIVVADTRDRMARDVSGLGLRVVTFMLPQDVAVVCSHVLMTHETGSHTRVSGEDSKGKTVYLCCEVCAEKFKKNPGECKKDKEQK